MFLRCVDITSSTRISDSLSQQLHPVRWRQMFFLVGILLSTFILARWQLAASSTYLWSAIVTETLLLTINASVFRFKPTWFQNVLWITIGSIGAFQPSLNQHLNDGEQTFINELCLMLQWISVAALWVTFLLMSFMLFKSWMAKTSSFN